MTFIHRLISIIIVIFFAAPSFSQISFTQVPVPTNPTCDETIYSETIDRAYKRKALFDNSDFGDDRISKSTVVYDYIDALPGVIYRYIQIEEVVYRLDNLVNASYFKRNNYHDCVLRDITDFPTPVEDKLPHNERNCSGSVVNVDRQILGESIPIFGSDFSLHYSSERSSKYLPTRQMMFNTHPSWMDQFPDEATLEVTYDDQKDFIHFVQPGLIESNFIYTWDGKDRSGLEVVEMPIEFNLKQTPQGSEGIYRGVTHARLYNIQKALSSTHIGGWSLSVHHYYLHGKKRLYRGDGTTVQVQALAKENNEFYVKDPDYGSVYIFDEEGKHLKTLHPHLGTTDLEFFYDSNNKIVRVQNAYNQNFEIKRTAQGLAYEVVGFYGHKTSLILDQKGKLVSVVHPNSEMYELGYTNGLLSTYITPNGYINKFTYDKSGRLTKDERIGGKSLTLDRAGPSYAYTVETSTEENIKNLYEYEASTNIFTHNLQRTETRSSGENYQLYEGGNTDQLFSGSDQVTLLYSEDPRFSERYVISADIKGVNNSYLQDWDGRSSEPFSFNTLTFQHTRNSATSTNLFDKNTRTWQETSFEGRSSTTTVDDQEKIISSQTAGFIPVQFNYDNFGRLTGTTQGTRTTQMSYNSQGLLSSTSNALGQTTAIHYDENQRVTSKTLPDGRQINYKYDPSGKLLEIAPPGRSAHKYFYSPTNETLLSYVPPRADLVSLPQNTYYQYNKDQRLQKITPPTGNSLTFNYTPGSNNLISIEDIYGHKREYKLYGIDGEPTVYDSPDFIETTVTRSYKQITSSTVKDSLTQQNLGTLNISYNDEYPREYRLSNTADNSYLTWYLFYDKDYLLSRVGDLTYTRKSENSLLEKSTIDNMEESYGYNDYGDIISKNLSVFTQPVYSQAYQRDDLGRIQQITQNLNGFLQTSDFTYDTSGRLENVSYQGQPFSQNTYDSNNNRISGTINTQPFTAEYDEQDRLLKWNDTLYEYNNNGERIKKKTSQGDIAYQWDAWNQLKKITFPNGAFIDYEYDTFGRKIQVRINGQLFYSLLYQNQYQPYAQLDASGNVSAIFYWGDAPNTPEYMLKNGIKYKFITNNRGDVNFVINTTDGSIAQQITYNEWGQILQDSNPGFQPFGYAGGLYDPFTQLTQFGVRHYDAEVGRWLSKDPIRFDGGDTNLYGYTLHDPVNFIDMTGLYWFRQPHQEAGVVGRKGTIVKPKGIISEFIEQYVPAGYTFGKNHDAFVDWTKKYGVPDALANIPSMLPIYFYATRLEMLRTLGVVDQPKTKDLRCK